MAATCNRCDKLGVRIFPCRCEFRFSRENRRTYARGACATAITLALTQGEPLSVCHCSAPLPRSHLRKAARTVAGKRTPSPPRPPRYTRNARPCASEDQVATRRGSVRPRRPAGPRGIYTNPGATGYLICGSQADPSKAVTRRSLRRSVSASTFFFFF